MQLFAFLLHSQSLFGCAFLFLGVSYTQFFFEFLKLHSEPFEYGHTVNAQPEFPFLLRISLYGLQADNPSCQFLGESHFLALFGYVPLQ